MNYTTKYCPGCYQNLRCHEPPCTPPCRPPKRNYGCISSNDMLFFAIGYIIARNCR